MFQKDKFWEKQKIYLWETWKKHIMCFSDFSFRNTFCVSVGKTLWKSQNVSLNGFFQGKHHPAPAVSLSPSPVRSHTKGHGVEMGNRGVVSIRFTQGTDDNGSDSCPAGQLAIFSDRSRQLRFCNRHRIVSTITRRQQMASCCIPYQIPFSGGAELWNPWQRDVGNCESVGGVEAFCGRCGASLWDLDRPQEPSVFHDGQEA